MQFIHSYIFKYLVFSGNLKVHQRIHSEDKPFKCTYEGCTRSFRCNETLKRHNLAHMGKS